MNNLLRLVFFLFLLFSGANLMAQTQKKPVKKTVTTQKTEQQKRIEAKAAARAKAKADSVAAVEALAKKLAREMFVTDSLKRVQEEEARLAAVKRKAELDEQQERTRKEAAITASSTKNRASGGGRFGIGLKGLGNAVFQNFDDYLSPEIGYGLGVITNLGLSERRALVLEILYNRYNFKVPDIPFADYYMDVIQVPLLYRWHTEGENKRFFVNSGLSGNFNKAEAILAGYNLGTDDEIKPFSISLIVGGGAEFMIGRGRLSIEARGSLGADMIVPSLSFGYTVFF